MPATGVLLLLTLGTCLAQGLTGGWASWSRAIGFIPVHFTNPALWFQVADGQIAPVWLTLVLYVFPHGGWVHAASNGPALYYFGSLAEREMGSRRFLLTYMTFGVLGAFCTAAVDPWGTTPSAGASLALCGVLGAYLARRLAVKRRFFYRGWTIVSAELAAVSAVAVWFCVRAIPPHPDRVSSVIWHFLPFLLGWLSVRIKQAFSRARPPAPGIGTVRGNV